MDIKLSKTKINSFVGDVQPIKLLSDEDISKSNILWSVSDSDIIGIRGFSGNDPQSISDGALVTLKKCGKAYIIAEFNGIQYKCEVNVRELKSADCNKRLNYYIGDLHDHMTHIHGHDEFAVRENELSIDYIRQLKEKSDIDFSIISDHAYTTNPRDFFKGFVEIEEESPMHTVIFAGSESEVTVVDNDRFGLAYKNAGEIVVINSDNFVNATSWEEFYEAMSTSPFGVGIFAHPYVLGRSVPGIWNFEPEKRTNLDFRRIMKGVEMGNGTDRESQMIYETFYSQALDAGLRVSATCASDSHGPVWGYDACPGKTVIMAEEKSREAFLDALLNCRFYATESGNVKLYYTVNGSPASSDIKPSEKYDFHIELSYFKDDPTTIPVKLEVISNNGRIVKSISEKLPSVVDFDIEYADAAYFYLRFVDSEGRKTWSAPIWTDKKASNPILPGLTPIDMSSFDAIELESGADAKNLICADPLIEWHSSLDKASYVIDMKEERKISAIGHYTPYIKFKALSLSGIAPSDIIAGFVANYRISLSSDGKSFTECKSGRIRRYSGEEIIYIGEQRARYVKFEVLSTAGLESGWPQHLKKPIVIGELTVFE